MGAPTSRTRRVLSVTATLATSLLFPLRAGAAETVWISAREAVRLVGPITLGGKTGIVEEEALGDFLVSTVCVSAEQLAGGYAEYQVRIPRAATYYVWARLRYPLGLDESFALIPHDEEPTADLGRAIGKSGPGVHDWHWDSRGNGPRCTPGKPSFALELPEGDFRFRIYAREAHDTVFAPGNWTMARPMFNPRLNVICLSTDAEYVPNDADARRALGLKPSRFDDASLRAAVKPLPPVSPEEIERRGKKPIPDWLRCPRFYTKDAWRGELEFRKPGDIAFMVRQIAANEGTAFRMAAYWGGDAYFQSNVAPHAPGLGAIDYLREAIDEGNRVGVKIVMYMNPNTLYSDHPLLDDAIIRRADGSGWGGNQYGIRDSHFTCINNPKYRDLLKNVLTEAFTRYGPAGLYVDGLTPHRCFCEHCRAKYRRMFGDPMPVEKLDGPQWTVLWEMVSQPELVGDPTDPDVQRYTEFLYQTLIEATRLVSTTVKQCKPDAVTMYHSWPKPGTLPYYDGTLTEIYVRTPWRHNLWKFGELANYSNIFPIPVLFNIYLHDHGTEAEARTKMIQGLANGCYPNCWNVLSMKRVFQFVRENAECFDFARTTPTRFLALVRNIRDNSAQGRLIADRSSPARTTRPRFLTPYVGLYSAVMRAGLPIVTLQQSDFHEHLRGYQVLCLANEACLSDVQIDAVRQFVADGGGLVATHETSLYDKKGNRRSDFGLADVFGVRFERMLPAAKRHVRFAATHPVTAGLRSSEPLVHEEPHALVRLAGGRSPAALVGEDIQAGPVPALVVHQYGAGRVVYVPGRLDAIQCDELTPAIEDLFGGAVRWVAGDRVPVRVEAPAPVAVTLFDQPNRRILHLVNLNGDTEYKSDKIEPIKGLKVQLQLPKGSGVTRLRRLWDKADVPFDSDGGQVRFQLDGIGEYEAVAAELDCDSPH